MSGQRLPLRIGGGDPVRGPRRVWRARLLRPRPRAWLALVGLAAAGGGAWLGSVPGPYVVALEPDAYVVAGARLPAQSGGVYSGLAGAVVISHRGGAVWAGGSTTLHGVASSGSCLLVDGASRERCDFELGGRRLSAIDEHSWLGWTRLYSDGVRVDIWLRSAGLVPVPFALGA